MSDVPLPPVDRKTPSVPVEFARLVLQMAEERGQSRDVVLAGLGIPESLIHEDGALLSIDQHEGLLLRAIALSGNEPGLGYEIGLRVGLTTHSLVAYALLSQMTLGDAIRLGVQYSEVFVPVYRGRLTEEEGYAVLDITMDMSVEPHLYRYAYDMALLSVWSGLLTLMGNVWPDVELWFNYPEPEYFPAYRDRLPACRFEMGANQICFPAAQLSKKIQTGDPVMAKLMAERMAKELEARKQQGEADIVTLIKPRLVRGDKGYPDLESVGAELFMSSRTLKRKLQQAGTGFQILLDDVRQQDAMRLLSQSGMSIEEIATWMGYAEPANFTHAFRRWTGMTPSEWRDRQRESG